MTEPQTAPVNARYQSPAYSINFYAVYMPSILTRHVDIVEPHANGSIEKRQVAPTTRRADFGGTWQEDQAAEN